MKTYVSHPLSYVLAVVALVAALGSMLAFGYQARQEQEALIDALQVRLLEVEARADQALAAIDLDAQYAEIVRVVAEKARHLEPMQVVEIAHVVQEQSILYNKDGVTPSLLLALMERESTFDPNAFSEGLASGLMQVIESTALIHLPQFGYSEWEHVRFNLALNIRVGVAELVRLRRGYINEGVETPGDSWTYTLHSYRWGPRNTRLLMNATEQRVEVPSLEYSVGVRELQLAYMSGGLD